jgi:hypothetical protein
MLLPISISGVQPVVHMSLQLLGWTAGCPSHGRGDQRVRSWGRARKREVVERRLGMRGGSGDVVSPIRVLLNKDRPGGGGVMVNGREYKVEEKACQSKRLGSQPRDEERVYLPWSAAEIRNGSPAGT